MSSSTPAPVAPSTPEEGPPTRLVFCRLRTHQTIAPTARARTRNAQRRKTHRLAPCKFNHAAPNHAAITAKTSPIPPTKCCQESCISPLPARERAERTDLRSVEAQKSLEEYEKQEGKENSSKRANCESPEPRV